MSLTKLTAIELANGYREKSFSPVEVLHAVQARAEAVNNTLNCLVATDDEGAVKAARASEQRWKNGDSLGPLDGVPVTIKDLILTAGMPTLYGSLTTIEDQPWTEDAPVVRHLRNAGAVVFAKTTTPEFGHKGATESLQHGITRNPWDTEKTPGGSSGGAAVAVATGLGPIAIGTDGGGSIRQPANFCGVVGFKPSATAIPIWPHAASWPLSVVGPLARSVEDIAACFQAVALPDDRDSWAGRQLATPYTPATLRGLRVAVAYALGDNTAREPVRAVVAHVARVLTELGATVIEDAPDTTDVLPIFRTMWDVGSAYVQSTIAEERRGLLEETYIASAMRGETISQVEYRKALADRLIVQQRIGAFYRDYDLLVLPVNPYQAFPVERMEPEKLADDAWQVGIAYTCPFNVGGNPAISLPVDLVDGLPVGVQLVGPMWSDSHLLAIAGRLEAAMGWNQRLAPYSP